MRETRNLVGILFCIGIPISVWFAFPARIALAAKIFEASDTQYLVAKFLWTMFFCLAFKSIIGFNFPWEKCSCCGKRHRDHSEDKAPYQEHVGVGFGAAKEIREGKTKSNVKSRPTTPEPKTPPPPQKARAIIDRVTLVNCGYLCPPKEEIPKYHCSNMNGIFQGDCPMFMGIASYCRWRN